MQNIKELKKAFTLIELVVVMSVLSILSTIAFISLQWYNVDARDWRRVEDVTNIKKALDVYNVTEWKYPEPTNPDIVTYSWAKIWTQWIFWDSVLREIKNLSKVPLDPKTDNKFSYSLLNNGREYELWIILEWEWNVASLYWNYNWLVTKVFTWGINHILTLPSITNSDMYDKDIVDILQWNNLVIEGEKNTPYSYTWTSLYAKWQIPEDLIDETEVVIYKWYLWRIDLDIERQDFLSDLQAFYSWVAVKDSVVIWNLLDIDTTVPSKEVSDYVKNLVNNYLWGKLKDIDFNPYDSCIWQNNPTPFSATTIYSWCDTADIIVCSWQKNWYTVSACNLWATVAGTSTGETIHNGSYFQWWNNYGHLDPEGETIKGGTKVDTIWYWPWNYYSSSVHIYWIDPDFRDWSSATNNNLWWDETSTTYTSEERQWPCSKWYHVPSKEDWAGIVDAGQWEKADEIAQDLLLPFAGNHFFTAPQHQWVYEAIYWSSSFSSNSSYEHAYLFFWTIFEAHNSFEIIQHTYYRGNSLTVRCFKDRF